MIKKILLTIAVSMVGIAIPLAILEVALRFIPQKKTWSDRPPYYFAHEASPTLQDYPITAKTEGGFRLAVVGDSYSFAPYMQFTDPFPKVLERMLNLNANIKKADVINYGVPAYSTSHEIEVVQKAIKDQSDLILLQITLNDPEIKPYRPIGITVFDTFGNLKLKGWKKNLVENWKTLGFVIGRLHNEKTKRDYIKYFNDLFDNPRTYKNFDTSIRSIVDICNKNSKKLIAVVFPLFGLPLDDQYPFMGPHNKVNQLLGSLNVPTLDLLEIYKGIPIDRLQVIPGEDRHPNEIAHRMAAEKIYDWMEANSYIPAELLIKKKYQNRTQIINEKPYTK